MVRSTPGFARKTALAIAIGAATASLTLPAAAQTDNRATTIEEVIVTAQKVEESLQDTPVSVAAFGTEELEQMGVSEAKDVGNYTPNLTIRKQTASQDNYAIAIRGVSSGETALAIDPTVGIYQDGVYIARSTGAAFDIVDLQRIEVLRGPQGTLFGRNTIGGAINIITERPAEEMGIKVGMGLGNYHLSRYQATLDTGRRAGVAAKVSLLRTKRDGQVESVYTNDDLGEGEANAARIALNWTPIETLSADYVWDYSRRDNNASTQQLSGVRAFTVGAGGAYFATAAAGASEDFQRQRFIGSSASDESKSDIDGHSLTIAWDFAPEATLKSITSYREWSSKARVTDFGSFPAPSDFSLIDFAGAFGPVGAPVTPGTLVPLFDAQRDSEQDQFSQELQLNGTLMDGRLRYIAGLYYFEEQAAEFNPQQFVLAGPLTGLLPAGTSAVIAAPFFDYSTDNKSYAAYGQATYTIATNLDLTLGLRYTVDEKETTLTNSLKATPGPLNPSTLQTVEADDEWDNLNPSATIDYRWSDELSTYFKVSTGYRSGGYNVRSDSVSTFQTPFDEENITSYELGIKSDLLGRTLRLNASIFRLQYDDRQIAQFSAGGGGASTQIVNAGESETDGLEIEAIYIPFTGMRVIATYGYLDVNYKEFITGVVDQSTGLPTGTNADIANSANKNLYAPEHNGSLALEYQFAPWSIGQLTVRVDASYTDDITFHPQFNTIDESDDFTLINARITLADIPASSEADSGRFKVAVWGKNLTDEEYRDFGIDFGALGFGVNTYGDLRTYGVDFVYEFNR